MGKIRFDSNRDCNSFERHLLKLLFLILIGRYWGYNEKHREYIDEMNDKLFGGKIV